MRRCIGCKTKDWMKFRFSTYQQHWGGGGYASPKVCLSAAYAWSRLVKKEYALWAHRRLSKRSNGKYIMASQWEGEGVCIVMHDGSSCTLGVMLRMYLPGADVMLYNKRYTLERSEPPCNSYFIVMCEDGISSGNSLYKMRMAVERPIDLFLTIGGKKLSNIARFVVKRHNLLPIHQLVKIHHQLDQGCNVWEVSNARHVQRTV